VTNSPILFIHSDFRLGGPFLTQFTRAVRFTKQAVRFFVQHICRKDNFCVDMQSSVEYATYSWLVA